MEKDAEIKNILSELGYPIRNGGNYISTAALYREGKDPTSICIYPNNNLVIDFVTGEKFSFEHLIALSLGLDSDEKVKKWLLDKNHILDNYKIKLNDENNLIKQQKILDGNILAELIDNHNYFINRGISSETLKLFQGGLCKNGRLKNRYVLPIYSINKELIGAIGRDISDFSKIKYKILGQKNGFIFPNYLNDKYIKEKKEIILVESPACILKLWDSNIKTALCLFGISCSLSILNYCIRINPRKIIIATNNEPNNKGIGNEAALTLYRKFIRYFDKRTIRICLPSKKDFGEMDFGEIRDWYSKI